MYYREWWFGETPYTVYFRKTLRRSFPENEVGKDGNHRYRAMSVVSTEIGWHRVIFTPLEHYMFEGFFIISK